MNRLGMTSQSQQVREKTRLAFVDVSDPAEFGRGIFRQSWRVCGAAPSPDYLIKKRSSPSD